MISFIESAASVSIAAGIYVMLVCWWMGYSVAKKCWDIL